MAIFINYRRYDDPGFATALYNNLEKEFGAGQLFMDVEGHIRPGDDFVEVIRAQVTQCQVMLTIIGPRWTELMSARANELQDFVVIEIEAALRQGKLVIPVLVGGQICRQRRCFPGELLRLLSAKPWIFSLARSLMPVAKA